MRSQSDAKEVFGKAQVGILRFLNTLLLKDTRYIVLKHFRFNSIMCHEKNQMMSNENNDAFDFHIFHIYNSQSLAKLCK